jgi:hypothetical protein
VNTSKKSYEAPSVRELGTVAELTLANKNSVLTDSEKGTPLTGGSDF